LNREPEIIIASHAGTDFDSLASMAAAKKLYPDAQLVLTGGTDENIREFLSLYGDIFGFAGITEIEINNLKVLVITDVGQKRRLGKKLESAFENDSVKIILYDHHLNEEKDFTAHEIYEANYGSATTVVLNELLTKGASIDPIEATLFTLGIYEDTGNLTFSSTTPRDLEVVAELLRRGARLDIVTRFLTHQLDPPQRQLLQKMLLNARQMVINGRTITFTTAKMNLWVKELALLTHKVKEMENADVIFAVVEMKEKLYLVGRSRLTSVNVAEVLGHFGGGGHHAAASATIPNGKMNKILPALIDTIRDTVPQGITARDIMSSPVLTIDPDDPISDAYEKMLRYGHSGLVVINSEDENIIGIISRKDVDKALSHQLGHAPVKSVMTRNVITITEGTTIDEMKDLVIEMDVGRLPVMFGGKLSGIVTRSDILNAIHRQTQLGLAHRIMSEEERKILINFNQLPSEYKNYIEVAGQIGDRLGYQIFLVGGIVRDLIMSHVNLDIDFLVEGYGHEFALEFGKHFDAKVDFMERFGTARIHIRNNFHIDVAMCRCEYYRKPGALPDVAPSGLRDDLYRRDFTINALAIRVNSIGFGELIDFFRGANDLEDRRIRTLHTLSFIDDPTRIFRAIRFEGRFGFKMVEETISQAKGALNDNMLKKIAPERSRHEIELILRESSPAPIILRGCELGLWNHVHKDIIISEILINPTDLISTAWSRYSQDYDGEKWRAYLPVIFSSLNQQESDEILKAMNFESIAESVIRSTAENLKELHEKIDSLTIDDIRKYVPLLSSIRIEALIFALVVFNMENSPGFEIIRNYLENLKGVTLEINGTDLIDLGHKPGKLFREAFREAYYMKLEGKLGSRKKELEFAHDYLLKLEKENS
jgi:tRNA nucleotidyltransferase (CCA-adding enzyme)